MTAIYIILALYAIYGLYKLIPFLFTKTKDEYPVRYYGKSKSKTKGAGDTTCARHTDTVHGDRQDHYAEIINDYPTYNGDDSVKSN